ncbi:MAG: UDP-N-acetylmuramoyl-L-alanine--D-glutamate ligase [Firmicutes bacterium]|nr:UDP-N-acetylmuramoyl-L-alanine--D-glutamate ligase [Bacillota bacterium]MCL5039178.1 UDP-N-acetylmuramoyl-L-alanine--D-glutamate ligase [Bacillota bacterium]
MELKDKRVAVVGLGVSNLALVHFLLREGARVAGFDQKTPPQLGNRYRELAALPLELHLGPGYLKDLVGFDLLFLTPGMRKDLPEIRRAREEGIPVLSEIALLFALCRAPIIGITGSAGKTTTTTLTGQILQAEGRWPVFVGGNIGAPLIEKVREIPPDALVVLELSSFQLEGLARSPWIGALLNISPNHLDIHASMEEYVAAKKNIFRHAGKGDVAVLNLDNSWTRQMADEVPGRVIPFTRRGVLGEGASCADGDLIWAGPWGRERILARSDILLPGEHNLENVLAAMAITLTVGVSPETLRKVVREFRGVEHRLELVRELRGVKYYNDSIATAPDRTRAAIETIKGPLILIAGGYDKHIGFEELAARIVRTVSDLVLLGVTADKIQAAVESAIPLGSEGPSIHRVKNMEEAVQVAGKIAQPGHSVLLSPACASYDMFTNFEERGRRFKELVWRLE